MGKPATRIVGVRPVNGRLVQGAFVELSPVLSPTDNTF